MEATLTTQTAYEKIREYFSRPDAVLARVVYTDPDTGRTADDFCVYREGEDPSSPVRCAFGVLIPDEMYRPRMENTSAGSVLDDNPVLAQPLGNVDRVFIDEAQSLHDSRANSTEHFVRLLDELAFKYDLAIPE